MTHGDKHKMVPTPEIVPLWFAWPLDFNLPLLSPDPWVPIIVWLLDTGDELGDWDWHMYTKFT